MVFFRKGIHRASVRSPFLRAPCLRSSVHHDSEYTWLLLQRSPGPWNAQVKLAFTPAVLLPDDCASIPPASRVKKGTSPVQAKQTPVLTESRLALPIHSNYTNNNPNIKTNHSNEGTHNRILRTGTSSKIKHINTR